MFCLNLLLVVVQDHHRSAGHRVLCQLTKVRLLSRTVQPLRHQLIVLILQVYHQSIGFHAPDHQHQGAYRHHLGGGHQEDDHDHPLDEEEGQKPLLQLIQGSVY